MRRALVVTAVALIVACSEGFAHPGDGPGFATPDQATPDPQAVADSILAATNEERSRVGLAPLTEDPALSRVARDHAEDMARRDYFDHMSPDGRGPAERVRDAGLDYSGLGENIAMHHSVEAVMEGWMRSPGHRANILGEQYRFLGVGVYRPEGEGTDTHYVQVFAY